MVFTHDMSDWLNFNINKEWLEANISWKDFGTGVRLGKLKREDKCSLVLYDADSKLLLTLYASHAPWWRGISCPRGRGMG